MTKSERLEFSGNVAESLLEDAWLDAVLGRMLHISDVTEEKLTLLNVVNRIELDRVRGENLQKRTADLLEQAVTAHLRLLDRVSKNRGIPVQMAARKTIPWHSDKPRRHHKKSENGGEHHSKRAKNQPTGLDFDDK